MPTYQISYRKKSEIKGKKAPVQETDINLSDIDTAEKYAVAVLGAVSIISINAID